MQNVYGGAIKTYDILAFQSLFADLNNFYSSYPEAQGTTFFIEHFAWQAVRAVKDEETANPHRDITAHLYVICHSQHPLTSLPCPPKTLLKPPISIFHPTNQPAPLPFLPRLYNYAYTENPALEIHRQRICQEGPGSNRAHERSERTADVRHLRARG